MPEVGVVVIGRNEGERLPVCLRSVLGTAAHLVYVDSGSSDASVDTARSMGLDVIELDTSMPYTAARARNRGLKWLTAKDPSVRFVQFVDGDCEMVDGWIERGVSELSAHEDAAVVFGRVRERARDASIYNRLCDMEWQVPIGEVAGSGGIAMMRLTALRAISAFDPGIIAAEDTELCARLRLNGWQILHVDAEMARHDAAMMHARQWWKRRLRAGYGYAQFSRLRGCPSTRFFARSAWSTCVWGCVLPALVLVLAWPTRGLALVLLAGYPVLACRVCYRTRKKGTTRNDALLYALHCTLGKFPQACGMFTYYLDRFRRRGRTLIEHKEPAPPAAPLRP